MRTININSTNKNQRILVIDDNRAIHDDFHKIISPSGANNTALDAAEAELFGEATKGEEKSPFEIDSAYQGEEGVEAVKKALEERRPYAMAFVDVRMPPGIDGVETTQKIWEIDSEIQIVICTAYSDYSWEEMFEKIGNNDRMVILKKPFDTVEASQLAHALTEKWWLSQQSKQKIEDLEKMVAERTRALEETNKELESFSYSVSHDLHAPLRSIEGFSRILLEDYAEKLDADGARKLQVINTSSQRMGLLIDDLLRLAQITRGEMRRIPVDLSALTREVESELRQSAPERSVEYRIEPNLIALGDPQFIRIALENLIGNAWKFTGKRADARIEFGMTTREGVSAYFVRDNGVGFDMANADKLFVAFQRLHSGAEFPGTGVGLTTVQRVIHRHGGRLWAESNVDGGTVFYFTLPWEAERTQVIDSPKAGPDRAGDSSLEG
jgi:two-component system, NtrC family, sensor kinase